MKISILGCGWMGLPLAKKFIQEGYDVSGSTTTKEKLETLKTFGIKPFLIQASPDLKSDNDSDLEDFFSSDVLFLNIPFRRSLSDPNYYFQQVQSVVEHCLKGSVKWIIFASSTSVYPSTLMNAIEDAEFDFENERAETLFKTEKFLLDHSEFDATVLRFAGLFGGERKLGNFVQGVSSRNPNAPVNLVHLEDVVGVCESVVEKKLKNEILNVCCDEHPLRGDFYRKAAKALGKPEPVFKGDFENSSEKKVSNNKLKELLNYNFVYPNPMDALN